MTSELLARLLQEFLSSASHGVIVEDGQVVFELDSAQYSISSERGRCLLHFWSAERNIVREVVDAETKSGVLVLSVRGFAKARPHRLEIHSDRDRRTTTTRRIARRGYAQVLERVIRRHTPDWTLDKGRLSTTMDLERSFSPVYARGLLRKGNSSFAVLGVSQDETQTSVDAALTFGLLWLEACREREAGRSLVEGIRFFVPSNSSSTLRIRLANLNCDLAKFQIIELEQGDESLVEIDHSDLGNIKTRLVQCPDLSQTRARFAGAIQRIHAVAPHAEVEVVSSTEISFRLHGLEFAQSRVSNVPGTFKVEEQTTFGMDGLQARLTPETETAFAKFVCQVAAARDPGADRHDPLWRMYPERWLESLVVKNVASIDSRLDAAHVYSQVPAFSASDRALIDVLTCTHDARLAVLELKADEDIHLPLQGLDYWACVQWHHQRNEFQQYGYFPGLNLSTRLPQLFLVAPSLRVHPAVDIVLRYFSPEIEWHLVGLDERWRDGVKVIYRKMLGQTAAG
jgi:hypothetical protein